MKTLIAILFLSAACAFAQTNVITSTNWVSTSTQACCCTRTTGYISFTKTIAQGWGYKTNTRPYQVIATNGVQIALLGKFGFNTNTCSRSITIPPTFTDPAYRFSVYFTNRQASCSITIIGLNP